MLTLNYPTTFTTTITATTNDKNNSNISPTPKAGKINRYVLSPEGRTKLNLLPDREFYSSPRFVTHVDDRFISTLTNLYRERLRSEFEVLDVMSSWVSHLPKEVKYRRVVGHGLNAQELARNGQLDCFIVKDLNLEDKFEFESQSFDAVLCTVSVQYLQHPEKVFAEIFRVLKPGGVFIVSFSNRMFYDKAISAWRDATPYSRVQLVVQYFQCIDGFTQPEMSEQFNQAISLTGKIPSGLFNAMFEFSACWQKDAANTKTLAFDGVFITIYTVALEKSQLVLRDHVKQAVPSSWEPAALARFIEIFGTHIIGGIKMGGKDVIYVKQLHSSVLQPADVQKRLKEMADKRFSDASEQFDMTSDRIYQNDKFDAREQQLRFADMSPSCSYSYKEDITSIFKRRGGSSENRKLPHHEWLQTVQFEPDVISMSFIPITSLLNGVPGSGFLSHAINLYLRYKPPIEELHQFLEFQLPRQWAPVFSELPLGPQRRQQNYTSLQFSFMGPKLYVNTIPVDVGRRPVTGLRLYLEGRRSNCLAIHLQHLSSLPKIYQLKDDPGGYFLQETYERGYYEKVGWKNFSHVCTAPVQSDNDLSIVTGAQLEVGDYGFKRVLYLRLRFSTVLGATVVKTPEWDGSPGLARKSGLISTLISHHFTSVAAKPAPMAADVNINSAIYPGGPPVPVQAPKLLKFVDTTEMIRGPQDTPGYWVVSGARLMVEKGKISLRVKYSLLTQILPDDEDVDEDEDEFEEQVQ